MDQLRKNVIDYLEKRASNTPWTNKSLNASLPELVNINKLGFITYDTQSASFVKIGAEDQISRGFIFSFIDKKTPNIERFFTNMSMNSNVFMAVVDIDKRDVKFYNHPTEATSNYNLNLNMLHLTWIEPRMHRTLSIILDDPVVKAYKSLKYLDTSLQDYMVKNAYMVLFINLNHSTMENPKNGDGLEKIIIETFGK